MPRGRGIETSVRGENPISTNGNNINIISSYEILISFDMFVLLIVTSSYEMLVAIIQDKPVILNIKRCLEWGN